MALTCYSLLNSKKVIEQKYLDRRGDVRATHYKCGSMLSIGAMAEKGEPFD